jgi:4-hydroxy-tetrahydrodipicolinate reductase
MSEPLRVALLGAGGRMGRSILQNLQAYPGLRLGGAVVRAGCGHVGEDAGSYHGVGTLGVPFSIDVDGAVAAADVAIDFSTAAVSSAHLRACVAARCPLLLGTTGLAESLQTELARAAGHIPLLVSANTSVVIALLVELVRQAAAVLPVGFDVEVIESHHRNKVDAPSGTALVLGAAAAEGRGLPVSVQPLLHGPGASGPRDEGTVGYAVVRGGDVVGEHEVRFLGTGERLSLQHAATDRGVFARGALSAAQWLARRPPGRYQMRDLFAEK